MRCALAASVALTWSFGIAEPAHYDTLTGHLRLPVVQVMRNGQTRFYRALLIAVDGPRRLIVQEAWPLPDQEETDDTPVYEPQIGRLYLPRVVLENLTGAPDYEAELNLVRGSSPLTFSLFYAAPVQPRETEIMFREGYECLAGEATPAATKHLYVSPSGNDAYEGTRDRPWRTLKRALCSLVPGQTLHVLPGVYRESVILGGFGDLSAPIVIRGEVEDGRWPVLEGDHHRTMGLALVESRNIVVENLRFQNYTDEGFYILKGLDITVRNSQFLNNGRRSIDLDFQGEGFGLNVLGTQQVVIENNEFGGNGPNGERWQEGVLGTGINTFEIKRAVIRGNIIYDTLGGGILVEEGEQILVEGNRIYANELDAHGDHWDGGIWVDGGRNVHVRNNTITGNHGPGIVLSDEENQYPSASIGYVIEDNVVTQNLFGLYIWNFGVCPPPSRCYPTLEQLRRG